MRSAIVPQLGPSGHAVHEHDAMLQGFLSMPPAWFLSPVSFMSVGSMSVAPS
jgi:hypothetical protein